MKIVVDEEITIFISKEYLNKIDINNKQTIENLIKKINDNYNVNLEGSLEISIYHDIYYGLIINIKKGFDYFDYFRSEIEMNIKIKKSIFLYKVDITNIDLSDNITVYKDRDNIYIKPNRDIFLGRIIENSEIIYGDIVKKIINKCNIINAEVITWKDK